MSFCFASRHRCFPSRMRGEEEEEDQAVDVGGYGTSNSVGMRPLKLPQGTSAMNLAPPVDIGEKQIRDEAL
ncbi:hypothetical protein EYF80_010517 [Liparis tanakae]|uniref:Uncharacterized protein n=1 Tax=Liparis tanakae TaxID=230148 RepID=A0A4Z2IPY6_9TELE|nr:hypothetical protein EYF80_010517 [Liparis tanakae]